MPGCKKTVLSALTISDIRCGNSDSVFQPDSLESDPFTGNIPFLDLNLGHEGFAGQHHLLILVEETPATISW